jgi:hypothetical protein
MTEARVLDEVLEPGKGHMDQVLPFASDILEPVIDPAEARLGRHLGEEDEDQLIEWVVLVAMPR